MKIRFIASVCIVCGLGALSSACGGADATSSKPKSSVAAKAPEKPRCAPNLASQPPDLQQRMSDLEKPLRKCFALGTAGANGTSTLDVEILVDESGAVKSATVHAEGAQPAAAECAQSEARKAHFAKFCGDDADIRWKYTLQ